MTATTTDLTPRNDDEIVLLLELFATGEYDDIPEYAEFRFSKETFESWQGLADSATSLKVNEMQIAGYDCTYYRLVDTDDDQSLLQIEGGSTAAVLTITGDGFGWTSNLSHYPQGDSWITSIFPFDALDLLVEKTGEITGAGK